jgi:hypothetical protein
VPVQVAVPAVQPSQFALHVPYAAAQAAHVAKLRVPAQEAVESAQPGQYGYVALPQ